MYESCEVYTRQAGMTAFSIVSNPRPSSSSRGMIMSDGLGLYRAEDSKGIH